MLSGRISEIDNIRNKMFHQMYVSTDDRTFIKCLNNDFTVIPFSIFFIKMIGIILYANSALTNNLICQTYLLLCLLCLGLKVIIIMIRKVNLLDSPMSEEQERRQSKIQELKLTEK